MFPQEISLPPSPKLQSELMLAKKMLFYWVLLVPESRRQLPGLLSSYSAQLWSLHQTRLLLPS
jgi:hypothetical protein